MSAGNLGAHMGGVVAPHKGPTKGSSQSVEESGSQVLPGVDGQERRRTE